MTEQNKELTHMSLCAGYGGIDLGLTAALTHTKTVCYSEIEAYAIENLIAKMEANLLDAAPIWTDLKTLPWNMFVGKVDILSGGFPCQPFSAAGSKKADEDPRHLWPFIVKGIKELQYPPIVFFENVAGILSAKLKSEGWSDPKDTPVLLHILRELERLGYYASAGIFSASEVGAPHQRKRVFIMGVNASLLKDSVDYVNGLIDLSKQNQKQILWPASRGEDQLPWEPPRVVSPEDIAQYENADEDDEVAQYKKLCVSVDNRTDELRLLGNGVVPATATKAFAHLWKDIVSHVDFAES